MVQTKPGVKGILSGTFAAMPAAGVANRYYWATDLKILYRDSGVAWQPEFPHYARYLWDWLGIGDAATSPGTGLVCLMPFQVPFTMTVDRLVCATPDVAATANIRMGIYKDNGDTPVGGALIVETASIANVQRKNELSIADTQLIPGAYWFAWQISAALNVVAHIRRDDWLTAGTWVGLRYGLVFGALTNPCPAVVAQAAVPSMGARVKSVP